MSELQQERTPEEQEMIAQWEIRFRKVYGNGHIFAVVFQKAIQDWDMKKIKPFNENSND